MAKTYETLIECIKNDRLVAMATLMAGEHIGSRMLIWPDQTTQGDLHSSELHAKVLDVSKEVFRSQKALRTEIEIAGEPIDVFINVYIPRPKIILVGAVHIAIELVSLAKILGFRTIVIDPRAAFATDNRFPHVDDLLKKWPKEALEGVQIDEATYFAFLSHDEKLDLPGLVIALNSPARYIGALGSARTNAKRADRLREMGFSETAIERIHMPIGLNIGSRGPEEIALSILSEMVAVSHGIGYHEG
jgi:xanthine dehydrogenase accessory factor